MAGFAFSNETMPGLQIQIRDVENKGVLVRIQLEPTIPGRDSTFECLLFWDSKIDDHTNHRRCANYGARNLGIRGPDVPKICWHLRLRWTRSRANSHVQEQCHPNFWRVTAGHVSNGCDHELHLATYAMNFLDRV